MAAASYDSSSELLGLAEFHVKSPFVLVLVSRDYIPTSGDVSIVYHPKMTSLEFRIHELSSDKAEDAWFGGLQAAKQVKNLQTFMLRMPNKRELLRHFGRRLFHANLLHTLTSLSFSLTLFHHKGCCYLKSTLLQCQS